MKYLINILLALLLVGCQSEPNHLTAPVHEARSKKEILGHHEAVFGHHPPVVNAWQQSQHHQGVHEVKRGETLYSIAWQYGLDYRNIAISSGIKPDSKLYVGQRLRLAGTPPKSQAKARIAVKRESAASIANPYKQKLHHAKVTHWVWPTKGPMISKYSTQTAGIAIGGKLGDLIRASAPGQVVYSGRGLRGYGKLLIIKHNDDFLSAYAHNNELLVSEGDWISTNQVIAKKGKTEAEQVQLHFEIRKAGEPQNPLNYLPKA